MSDAPRAERRPLEGVRVLDCGTIIAAPYAATLLADWGADVIKIEHPDGDSLRRAGPVRNGAGLNYKFYGRNKRHMVLNLSAPKGQEVMRELIAKSDVLIENFRPGVMEKWGLGWEQVRAVNDRLVMLRVSGFGQDGPYAKRPGFGTLAESMSGFAHINGYPDGPPTLPPFGLADGIAALSSAYAVMLALYERDARGGRGQMIDVALIEPILHVLGGQPIIYDQTGAIQGRSGNRSVNNAPRNNYLTRDGRWLAISTAAQAIAERVMELVGHPEVIAEPWFRSGVGRARHGVGHEDFEPLRQPRHRSRHGREKRPVEIVGLPPGENGPTLGRAGFEERPHGRRIEQKGSPQPQTRRRLRLPHRGPD
jgi:formyl-CoA transferase